MRVEDVPVEALADLGEDLADLRHDLGKYVTFEVRFAGREAAETEALRAALQRDLLRTYSRQGADQAAWEVWARLRPALLDGDPDVAEIDAALGAYAAKNRYNCPEEIEMTIENLSSLIPIAK